MISINVGLIINYRTNIIEDIDDSLYELIKYEWLWNS